MVDEIRSVDKFDFQKHRVTASENYERVRENYSAFSSQIEKILDEAFKQKQIKVQNIEYRAKTIESFGIKVVLPSEADSNEPKYKNPLDQITDLAGVRVITFFPKTVDEVSEIIKHEFKVIEIEDKTDLLAKQEKLGYASVHFVVQLNSSRENLSEYAKFKGMKAEIQVRTVLQHAWAEIEHDIRYKSVETIPLFIKRRFMTLAGLLEIADREFQLIQEEDEKRRTAANISVEKGNLERVEITGDTLKTYLDRKLGSDARIALYSYEWEARRLVRLGFKTIKQIDDCIKNFKDYSVNHAFRSSRDGQISRFQNLIFAGLGEQYYLIVTENRGGKEDKWTKEYVAEKIKKLKEHGITVGNYNPRKISE